MWNGTQFWTDQVYLSPDAQFIPGRATLLGNVTHSNNGGLANGESYTESEAFTLPRGIGGDFFIYVFANVFGTDADAIGRNDDSRESFHGRAFETPGNNAGQAHLPGCKELRRIQSQAGEFSRSAHTGPDLVQCYLDQTIGRLVHLEETP